MNSEPAAGTGVIISAGLYLLWIILDTTGVSLTDDLKDAVKAFILLMAATPAVAGLLIRFQVTPTAKAEDAINKAYVATPAVDPKPTL